MVNICSLPSQLPQITKYVVTYYTFKVTTTNLIIQRHLVPKETPILIWLLEKSDTGLPAHGDFASLYVFFSYKSK